MGCLKIFVFISLLTIIFNVGLHYEVINASLETEKTAKQYVQDHCYYREENEFFNNNSYIYVEVEDENSSTG